MRKEILLSVVTIILSLGVIVITEWKLKVPVCKDCNIVLISLDTLGAKHLPCYGYELNTAPNLCQFGKENVIFKNAYAQSYWTLPSQTSVITSTYPTTHKATARFSKEVNNSHTLAEVLKQNNYETWYFGPDPQENSSFASSFEKGYDHNLKSMYKPDSLSRWQKGVEVLKENQKKKKATFLYLHTYYVHDPYLIGRKEGHQFVKDTNIFPEIPLTREEYRGSNGDFYDFVLQSLQERISKSRTKDSLKRNLEMLKRLKGAVDINSKRAVLDSFDVIEADSYRKDWYHLKYFRTTDIKKTNYIKSLYDEKVYGLDLELRDFLKSLENIPEFSRNTILVIYGDHGEGFNEHGSFEHGSDCDFCLYDELIKVPLMMKIPGVKNREVKELAQLIDIYPTLLKLVGIRESRHIQGIDLNGLIFQKILPRMNRYVIAEQSHEAKVIIDQGLRKLYVKDINTEEPKLIEYYDLRKDPDETNNQADKYPQEVDKKLKILMEFKSLQEEIPKVSFPEWMDEVKREKLMKGGYF